MGDTLFRINWGDNDNSFVIAPDEETAKERMSDGKDMVNYVVRLDALYQRIFKAGEDKGFNEVVEWIENNSANIYSNDTRHYYNIAISLKEWQAFLKERLGK